MENIYRLVSDSMARHENPEGAPSLSRSVRQGGSFGSNLDHLRLEWSRWFRCESSFSVLLVPAKPGIFALGEEMVPPTAGNVETASPAFDLADGQERVASKRMLALFEISETDDLGMALGRLFLPNNQFRERLASGRCFARYAVIEDAAQRSAVCASFRRWMQDSAETASGISSTQPAAVATSNKVVDDNSPSTSSAWGVGFMGAPNRETKEVVGRPKSLPSGF
jgi:hypothetical protein